MGNENSGDENASKPSDRDVNTLFGMLYPLATWLLESWILKGKEERTKVFNSQLASESNNKGKSTEENLLQGVLLLHVVRSLRDNIREHTLHVNIDLDLQETWFISKRETGNSKTHTNAWAHPLLQCCIQGRNTESQNRGQKKSQPSLKGNEHS